MSLASQLFASVSRSDLNWEVRTSAKTPLTTEAANTGSVGLPNPSAPSSILLFFAVPSESEQRETYARQALITKHEVHPISGNALPHQPSERCVQCTSYIKEARQGRWTYAFAKHPPIPTAKSMTGPKSIARDFIILDLSMIRDGKMTPAERTWIPSTIRVNYRSALCCFSISVRGEDRMGGGGRDRRGEEYGGDVPIVMYSWLYPIHPRPPNLLEGYIEP